MSNIDLHLMSCTFVFIYGTSILMKLLIFLYSCVKGVIYTSLLRDSCGSTLEPKWRHVGTKRLKRQMLVNETKRLSFNAETKVQRLTASGY